MVEVANGATGSNHEANFEEISAPSYPGTTRCKEDISRLETMSDLCEATAEEMAEVERTLAATGAGSFHLRQIRDALSALRSESGQRDGAAGSSGATTTATTTTAAVAVAGGRIVQPWITQKRYAAFLSHHQRDSATCLWMD